MQEDKRQVEVNAQQTWRYHENKAVNRVETGTVAGFKNHTQLTSNMFSKEFN